jgi:TolA-binding protein
LEAADSLPKEGGRADVLYFAGRLAAAHREPNVAQRALEAAIAAHPVGPVAAPAEFALAESYARAGQAARATEHLEHLILTYPQSAMVPQARRLLDQVKGKTPRS